MQQYWKFDWKKKNAIEWALISSLMMMMDPSYRSHKSSFNDGETYEIRPAFPAPRAPLPPASNASVTGFPSVLLGLDLDEPLNTLDPGQLLRESAAAATRAALLSHPPVRSRDLRAPPPRPVQTPAPSPGETRTFCAAFPLVSLDLFNRCSGWLDKGLITVEISQKNS